MKGFEFDNEKLKAYFRGEYSEKDEDYVNNLFTDEISKIGIKESSL